MKQLLKKLFIVGFVVLLGGFFGGCYTQLQKYSAVEESYSASKSEPDTTQESTQTYSNPTESSAEQDTEYVDNWQGYNQPGTTNIYNYYAQTTPYGPPYWPYRPYGWYGDQWFDYPFYSPYQNGFYFSVTFGSPYYYDPYLWDWRYSTPLYNWGRYSWYNPYRYYYGSNEWGYGGNWWWYSNYTIERRKQKHRPFNRREGLNRGSGALINAPAVAGGSMGAGSSARLNKPFNRPNNGGITTGQNMARIRKQAPGEKAQTTDAIQVNKNGRSEKINKTRIRKARRYDNTKKVIIIRHPRRMRQTPAMRAENRTRRIGVKAPSVRHKEPIKIRRTRAQKASSKGNRIHTAKKYSPPSKSSTRMRNYSPPARRSEPTIRHRSRPSNQPSYSPPARRSQPAVRAPRPSSSSSSKGSRSRRDRK